MKQGNSKGFSAWLFFEKNKDKSKCIICGKLISTPSSSTTGMIRHLEAIHTITKTNFQQKLEDLNLPINPILKFCRSKDEILFENDEQELLVHLIVLDRIPLNTIVRSKSLNYLFRKLNFTFPKSANTLKKMILEQKKKIAKNIEIEINNLIKNKARF